MALKASSTNFDEAFCDVLYSIIHMYREKCSTEEENSGGFNMNDFDPDSGFVIGG